MAFVAARRLVLPEYLIILLIFAFIVFVGFTTGIAVGLVAAAALFLFEYGRVDSIRHALTGSDYQRSPGTPRSRPSRQVGKACASPCSGPAPSSARSPSIPAAPARPRWSPRAWSSPGSSRARRCIASRTGAGHRLRLHEGLAAILAGWLATTDRLVRFLAD
jgi:hypothetical protein